MEVFASVVIIILFCVVGLMWINRDVDKKVEEAVISKPTLFLDPVTDDYVTRIKVRTRTTKAGETVEYFPEILYKDSNGEGVWNIVDNFYLWHASTYEKAVSLYPKDESSLAYAKYAVDLELKKLNSRRVISTTDTFIKHP